MIVKENNCFDYFENDVNSKVIELIPDYFGDDRGYFMEVLRYDNKNTENLPTVLRNPNYIKQINRSSSSKSVFRGFHAQFGPHCQGKLVEVLTEKVYDIIVDVRPNSKSFGISAVVLLDSKTHNKLWVPRGFLHGFIVPNSVTSNVLFEYVCDNVYSKESEINIKPDSILDKIFLDINLLDNKDIFNDLIDTFNNNQLKFSEKDMCGENYESFLSKIKNEYIKTGRLWFN